MQNSRKDKYIWGKYQDFKRHQEQSKNKKKVMQVMNYAVSTKLEETLKGQLKENLAGGKQSIQ